MQLMLMFGIAFAIAAVAFALQNNVPVTVALAVWRFDTTLAMALLLALGLGAIVAALVSSPMVIRSGWTAARLRRQLADAQGALAASARRASNLEAEIARLGAVPQAGLEEPRAYVGLKALVSGGKAADLGNE